MEVQRESKPKLVPPPAPAEGPKLTIEKFADGPITCLRFTGTIDEGFDGKKLAHGLDCESLVLDTGGVKKISSFGIREWVDFIGLAAARTKQTVMIECSPKVVDQLNMVANFAGTGRVFSFYAPFRCDYCDSEHRVLLDVAKDAEAIKAQKLAERPCPACHESMYFDDDGTTYFSYLLGQGPFELEAPLVQFLAAKLDYRVGSLDGKLKIDKVIEGRITYLRLTGDLNNTFQKDKVAEGLEGTVIVDLAAVARVEPAGAAAWRAFVQQVGPLVDQIDLIGVAPAVLERICTKDDLGTKVFVLDFALPYGCAHCGTTSGQVIDVVTHAEVLKFATAPELRCPACKTAMQCTASEALMTILPALPKPTVTRDLARQIDELRHRKLERRVATVKTSGEMPPLAQRRGANVMPLLLVLLVAVIGIGGYLAYTRMRAPAKGPYGLGPVTERSAPDKPAWLASPPDGPLQPGATSCIDGLTCVGVSQPVASLEDAENDASDAAFEATAYQLASDSWLQTIAPQVPETRTAALAAVGRDAQSAQAWRDVRDGRHAVARLFKHAAAQAPQVSARYWDAFETPDGKRYVAFAEVAIDAKQATPLRGAAAAHPQSALGATVIDVQPELGWRFQRLDHGAIIVKLDHGPLQAVGLAEHYIVLAIDGHDVADAVGFGKLANDEYDALSTTGGTLRVLVQSDAGDPREFSTQIAGPAPVVDPTGVPRPGVRPGTPGASGTPTPGAVNVWDRYGGNRGSGRDDPTQ